MKGEEGKDKTLPSLSLWKSFKNLRSLSLFRRRMLSICGGFFGFATNTYSALIRHSGKR